MLSLSRIKTVLLILQTDSGLCSDKRNQTSILIKDTYFRFMTYILYATYQLLNSHTVMSLNAREMVNYIKY